MLASKRHRYIVDQIQENGQVTVATLAKELSVTAETIRRDILFLDKSAQLKKVHGGAVALSDKLQDSSYSIRAQQDKEAKLAIAKYAASLVADNDVIALDVGTTLDEFAQHLDGLNNITILVCSICALNILINKLNNGDFTGKILFMGGEIDPTNQCAIGAIPSKILQKFSIDKAFIGATAISSSGIRAHYIHEGVYAAQMAEQASTVFVLATSSKIGKEALFRTLHLDQVDHLITDTDNSIPTKLLTSFESSGIQLHSVSTF